MRKLLTALLVAAVLTGALAVTVDAQTTWQRFENVWAKALRVTNNATVGGTLAVTGNTTVGGTFGVTGSMTGAGGAFAGQVSAGTDLVSTAKTNVGTFLVTGEGAVQVLAPDSTLTPVTTYQPVSSTAAIGTSSIASMPSGARLDIVNVGSQTITFTDTGTLRLSGNIALGAYDTLSLVSAGTGQGWIQLATTNN